MINTTTMLAHIKGSVRDFLYPFQDENRTDMGQYGGEISWEASSTTITGSPRLMFLAMDRFFTPYRAYWGIYKRVVVLAGKYKEIHLWQEGADVNPPPAWAHYLAKELPHCQATFFPDEEHFTLLQHWEEILKTFR